MVHITLQKQEIGHESWPSPLERPAPPPADKSISHRTFFELAVDDKPIGRVVFGLFGNALPKTVESFRALCAGDKVCPSCVVFLACVPLLTCARHDGVAACPMLIWAQAQLPCDCFNTATHNLAKAQFEICILHQNHIVHRIVYRCWRFAA